ncbi:MAG: FMN-binding protein [Rikenellaceae bacterium]|nr:FMN-binding protein [Rikenellaceae bacterium]
MGKKQLENEVRSEKKSGFDKNSNTYIITYSVIMVVIVAAVLAFAALSLQPKQEANTMNEKKMAILASIGIESTAENVDAQYAENITAYAVDARGDVVESISADEVLDGLKDLRAFREKAFPVFVSKDGRNIVPVIGKGLWGDIWGYVALDGRWEKVKGVVFDHKGETPGLGAEITSAKFRSQFEDKRIFDNGQFVSVAVLKGAGASAGNDYAVDAVSGGTITSRGVQAMLRDCLGSYVPYIEKQFAAQLPSVENNQELNEESNE